MRIPNLSSPYTIVRSNLPDAVRHDAVLFARALARWENEGGAVREPASAAGSRSQQVFGRRGAPLRPR